MFVRLKNVVVVGVALCLPACTSMMWQGNSSKSYAYEFKVAQQDELLGFTKLTPKSGSKPAQFVILGKAHSYWVTDGNEDIGDILAVVSNPAALKLVTGSDKAIKLGLQPNSDAGAAVRFVGRIQLQYTVPNSQQAEIKAWQQLPDYLAKPQLAQTVLSSNVRIVVEPHAPADAVMVRSSTSFKERYTIKLGTYEQNTSVDVRQLLNNAVATPFTLATDLVMIPMSAVNQGVGKGIQQLNADNKAAP